MGRLRSPTGPGNGWWLAIFAVVIGGLLYAAGRGPQRNPTDATQRVTHVPGEVLIRYKDRVAEPERIRVRSVVGARRVRGLGRSVEQLTLGRGRTVEDAIRRLTRDPAVEYAEPNYLFQLDVLPDDPRFDELYGLRNTGQTGGVPGADINAEDAWGLTTGSREVIVGVIDSGVDYNHPDLAANIWNNPGEIPDNGTDDDGNGYVDDVRGWDFANDDNDPFDDVGHGTHVAGTIGAVGDNALGVTGVAWKVRIVPLKFIASNGFGTTADAVAAVEYATAIGADVTNNSWGGGAYSRALEEAIEQAAEANVVFVAAAGNQGLNTDQLPHFPSSYRTPNVISVTAVNHGDVRPLFANVGPVNVDLGAPGVNVLSTLPNGAYGFNSGTSMASPHVAGAVALIRALAPEIGVVEIRSLLMAHVDPAPTLGPLIASGGRLNVGRSLAARDLVPPGAVSAVETVASTSNTVELRWIATGDDGDQGAATTYELRYAPWPIDLSNVSLATRFWRTPTPGPAGSVEAVEIPDLDPSTAYYFSVRALDEWGNAGPLSFWGSGTTLPAPIFDSSPREFELSLFSNETATRTLIVSNVGPGTLDWRALSPPDAGWIEIAPVAGRLLSGESRELTLRFETRNLAPGRFETAIEIETNDPGNPLATHPVLLELVGAPAIEVDPAALELGDVVVGASASGELVVRNVGAEPLVVDPIVTGAPTVTLSASRLDVEPGSSVSIDVTYAPDAVVPLDDAITLSTNAAIRPTVTVPIGGRALPAPAISVEPLALSETLLAGTTVVRPLRIHNPGQGVLVVDLRFEAGSDSGALLVSPLTNGGFEEGDFTGWEAKTNDLFTFVPWTVSMAGGGSFQNSAPVEGEFDALNGFEGQAGLRFDLSQELAIPGGTTRAQLSYVDRIQWQDFGARTDLPRIYLGAIEDLDGNRLAVFLEEEILFDGSGYTDLGWQRRVVDLAPYAGRTVRLRLREVISESLIGLAQIEFDDFRIDIEGFPDWFGPELKRVVIEPGSHADVDVTFDASRLLSAYYDARIRLETNVPAVPVVTVPVTLEVYGIPRFTLRGPTTVLESIREFSTAGAVTEHILAAPAAPLDVGVLELAVEADIGQSGESVNVQVEGNALGAMGNTGFDCEEAVARFELSSELLSEILADGVVHATVRNTSSVQPVCRPDLHTVRLIYDTSPTHIDFEERFVGSRSEIHLIVANTGTAPLELTSIDSDLPVFAPSSGSGVVEVGESLPVTIAFESAAAGRFDGTLSFISNDPDTPRFDVLLTGVAVDAPTIEVDPGSVELRLPVGGETETIVRVTNRGDLPLVYTADVAFASDPYLTVAPVEGSVDPDATGEIVLRIDSSGLAPGAYDASLRISSDLPVTPAVAIPVRLIVEDAPDIDVTGPVIRVASSLAYGGSAARTVHRLPVDRPASPPARLLVTLAGDFGAPAEEALVFADGVLLGSAGGVGPDCYPRLYEFAIPADRLAAMTADGQVAVTVQNGDSVTDKCPVNRHTVWFDYREFANPLDLGFLFVGWSAERRLVVSNTGSQPLSIASVTTDHPDLVVLDGTGPTVEPGESWQFTVEYRASTSGAFAGSVFVESDDPDEPLTTVDVVASVADLPRLRLEPDSIDVALEAGESATRSLIVSNDGDGPLGFAVSVDPASSGVVVVPGTGAGTVPTGGSATVEVIVDAFDRFAGTYHSTLRVETNDPSAANREVPVRLEVSGTPRLQLSTASIDFGETIVGTRRARRVTILNTGSGPLELQPIQLDSESFESTIDRLRIEPGAGAELTVGFTPPTPGPAGVTVAISSNDPAGATAELTLAGVGVGAPRVTVDPVSVEVAVEAGGTVSRLVRLSNSGSSPLRFDLWALPSPSDPELVERTPSDGEWEARESAPWQPGCLVSDPGARTIYAQARGGTAFARYDGVSREWVARADAPHTSALGCGAVRVDRKIYTAYADGRWLGVYDIGEDRWSSILAAVPFTAVLAADDRGVLYQAKGRIARSLELDDGSVRGIASPPFDFGIDGGALHRLGDALLGHASSGGTGFARFDPASGVWTPLPGLPGAGATAVVDPVNGAYLVAEPARRLLHRFDSSGWETRELPVAVATDAPLAWLPDPIAGLFVSGGGGGVEMWRLIGRAAFVDTEPYAGVVQPGGTLELLVRFDATGRFAGVHEASLVLRTNDPGGARLIVPTRMTVSGQPRLEVSTDRLDFGPVFVGTDGEILLPVENRGTSRLELSATFDQSSFSAAPPLLEVAPGSTELLALRFAPAIAGPTSSALRLVTNDADAPEVWIESRGTGSPRPVGVVEPSTLETTLEQGDAITRLLTLRNNGLGTLEFSIAAQPSEVSFLVPEIASGSVAPDEAVQIPVRFDASLLAPGVYPARLLLTTNDPFATEQVVPSSLTVVGYADIALGTEPVVQESTLAFNRYARFTVHSLPATVPPAGSGTIEITVDGDFGNEGETATATAEGLTLGVIGEAFADCSPATRSFSLDAASMARLAEDGLVVVNVHNDEDVRPFCTRNLHRVRLTYVGATDRLDFGTVFLGERRELELTVENVGPVPLVVGSIGSDAIEFAPTESRLEVPPGASRTVAIEFRPSSVGHSTGTLSIQSNDPDTPEVRVALEGEGADTPVIRVEPSSLAVSLAEGSRATRTLSLANDGNGPLDFVVTVTGGEEGWIRTETAGGTLAAGDSTAIDVRLDADRLPVGTRKAAIELSSNDPGRPRVVVPVTLEIFAAPNLEIRGERLTLESIVEFNSVGALTHHELPVELLPAGDGRFEIIGDGDFGVSQEYAVIIVEGSVIGTVGGAGADCIPSVASFPVDRDYLGLLADDLRVEVDVQNTTTVDPICERNAHTVRLVYDTEAGRVDFGDVFVGQSRRRAVALINQGNLTLEIDSIAIDDGRFTPERTTATLGPGDSVEVGIVFTPDADGQLSATLSVASNDPDTPLAAIPVEAGAVEPPVLALAPESIEATLDEGEVRHERITLGNGGPTPLVFEVAALPDEDLETGFTLYGTDGGAGNLYTIDLETGRALFVGPLGVGAPALAVDPTTGVMYVGQGGGLPVLYTVDPATAVISAVGDNGLGPSAYAGLDFDSEGSLYAAMNLIDGAGTGGDTLTTVDKGTGKARVIGPFGAGIGTAGGSPGISGITFDPVSGILYGASGAQAATVGNAALYAIDRVTGAATFLRPILDSNGDPPEGGVGSLQFDSEGRLFAGTGRRNGRLLLVEPETGRFTQVAQLFPQALGGLALRMNPVDLSFVDVAPASGSVPPGGSVELDLTLDARALPPGRFDARVVVLSNDPEHPEGTVRIGLAVVGIPDLALPDSTIALDSTIGFDVDAAETTHELSVDAPSAGGALLRVVADGDFGALNEVAEVRLNGVPLGRVGHAGSDCAEAAATFAISAGDFAEIAHQGRFEVRIENAATVGAFCPSNRHVVSLTYETPRTSIDFGLVYLDYEVTVPLTLRNDGRAELEVGSIEADRPSVSIDAQLPFVVPPFGSVEIPLSYRPTSVEELAGSLIVRSNDPDEPEVALTLDGSARGAPVAVIEPDTLEAALAPGGERIANRNLRVENRGSSELVWSAEVIETRPEPASVTEWVERPKGDESANGAGSPSIERSGGPDAFGYRYRDSDDVDGPRFDWIDISGTGQSLDLQGDDLNSGALPLGFGFPFYGERYDLVFVSSNGWLSFSSEKTSYSNADALPNAGFSVPENLVAPFWDDLDLREPDAVRYLDDGERFILQFTDVDRFASAAELTFQVILHRSGRIVFQYLSMEGVLDSATIGMQNEDRSIGLLVAYNEPYVHGGLAIELAPVAPWAAIAPASGVVPAGGFVDLDLALTARDLEPGRHTADLRFRTNDPAERERNVPITLAAATVELARLEIHPQTINAGSRGQSIRATLQLPQGFDPRRILLETVTLEGRVAADPQHSDFGDADGDGIEELTVRFDRRSVLEMLTEGDFTLHVSGEVAGQAWFTGSATVRVVERGRSR